MASGGPVEMEDGGFAGMIANNKFQDYNTKQGKWEYGTWEDRMGPGGIGQSEYDVNSDRQVNILDLVNLSEQMNRTDDPANMDVFYQGSNESRELPGY